MSFAPVGDLARQLLLRRSTSQTKSDLNRLAQMMASNRKSDIAAAERGNMQPITGLENSLAKLDGWGLATAGLSLQMKAMQSALGAISKLGQTTADAFLLARQPQEISMAAHNAFEALDSLLNRLNTRVGDDWVFSGQASDQAAVRDAETLLTALQPELAGLTTAAAVEAKILAWMQDPAGFAAAVYTGGPPVTAIRLSPQDDLAHGITATDPGLARVMAGLAMGALLDRGLLAGDETARQQAVALTAESLMTSAEDTIYLAAKLGQAQNRLGRIETRNAAERSTLEIERSRIIGADPEQTAAELTQASAQLDLLYAMTARLSSLTLLNFLR